MGRTALAAVWPPTAAIAGEAGHPRISPMQAIRRKCLNCCGNQPSEVKLCETGTCALWPFRAGRHPYTKRGLEEGNSYQDGHGDGVVPIGTAPSETAPQEADFGEDVNDAAQPSPPSRNGEAL